MKHISLANFQAKSLFGYQVLGQPEITVMKFSRRLRWGFTLVELLVVIAIIGILVALLLPAIQSAREAARRSACTNNIKQLGLALQSYHDTYGKLPVNYNEDTGSTGRGSALTRLLPYIEEQAVYDSIDFTVDYTFVTSKLPDGTPVFSKVIATFVCPSENRAPYGPNAESNEPGFRFRTVPAKGPLAITSYLPSMGNQYMPNDIVVTCTSLTDNIFGTIPQTDRTRHGNTKNGAEISGPFSRMTWSAKFKEITDGLSNTIALGEVRQFCGALTKLGWFHHDGAWVATTGPINSPTCPGEQGVPIEGATGCQSTLAWNYAHSFRSPHPGGTHFVFCDASVHFVTENIDYDTYQRLGDRRDGKPVGAFQ
jgi:prepilin-type N-terminal cleavage/methylation domain-containing protein